MDKITQFKCYLFSSLIRSNYTERETETLCSVRLANSAEREILKSRHSCIYKKWQKKRKQSCLGKRGEIGMPLLLGVCVFVAGIASMLESVM